MIDFTFTEEQELFQKAAREFSETQIAPLVPAMEETGREWDPSDQSYLRSRNDGHYYSRGIRRPWFRQR